MAQQFFKNIYNFLKLSNFNHKVGKMKRLATRDSLQSALSITSPKHLCDRAEASLPHIEDELHQYRINPQSHFDYATTW